MCALNCLKLDPAETDNCVGRRIRTESTLLRLSGKLTLSRAPKLHIRLRSDRY